MSTFQNISTQTHIRALRGAHSAIHPRKKEKKEKNYLYILNIWTQNNLLLMQSACYIMHGLSLSQRSFTPCCASPPTAPRRQADTHTHTLHLVLTVIYSTLALPPTLSVCSQTATQMSERERRRGRHRVGGVRRLKVKGTKRENLQNEV